MKIEKEIVQKKAFTSEWVRLNVNFLFTHSYVFDQVKKVFAEAGLTPQQFNILRILKGQYPDPVSPAEIRNRMIDRSPDVSRMITRLESKGLVESQVKVSDKRSSEVFISQKGMELLEQANSLLFKIEAIYQNLTMEEAEQLNELLEKLRG